MFASAQVRLVGSLRVGKVDRPNSMVVDRLLIGADVEENASNLLQDRAVELTSWRDWKKPAEEAYSTVEKELQAISVDQLAHVRGSPRGEEDKHITKLTVNRRCCILRNTVLRMCGAMYVGHNQSMGHTIQSYGALHGSFNASYANTTTDALDLEFLALERQNAPQIS
jgi:hypothetical protein